MERLMLSLAERQAAEGHHVQICAVEPAKGDMYIVPKGIVCRLGRWGLWQAMLHQRPDVVHAHNLVGLRAAWMPARLWGCRLVFTKHGMHFPGGSCDWLMQRPDAIATVSRTLQAKYTERFPGISSRITYIPNGISALGALPDRSSARAMLQMPEHAFMCLWVGRMVPEKGLDVLLQAFAAVGRSDIWLWLVGNGPERPALEVLADRLGICDRVCFAGMQQDVRAYYAAADVFVLPSRSEGLPMALLEAGVSGLPAVVSDVGEMPAMLNSSRGGIVVFSGDRDALTLALQRMQDMAVAERQACGARLRQWIAEAYSNTRMMVDYGLLYRR